MHSARTLKVLSPPLCPDFSGFRVYVTILIPLILKLSESYIPISSYKHHGKISLDTIKDGALGISQLKDSKVRICTQNEEEGLSFIICDVVQHNIVSLRTPKDNQYLEVGIFSGIDQVEKNRTAKKNDRNTSQHNGFLVAPQSNGTSSIEVSAD